MRATMAVILGVACGLLLPRLAVASAGRGIAALEWQVDPGLADCVSKSEFSQLAEERMGRPLFRLDGQGDRVASVQLTRTPSGLVAIVELRDRTGALLGRRELLTDGPSCRTLVDHTILVVGLMLDYAKAEPVSAPTRNPIRVPETARPKPWRVRVGLSGEMGRGLLPATSRAAGLDLAVITPVSWSFEISGFVHQSVDIPETDQAISTAAVRLAICPLAFERGRFRLEACLAQQTARLRAVDADFPPGRTQEHLSVAAGPRARLDVSLWRPIFAAIAAGVEVPFSRVAFNDVTIASAPAETYRVAPLFGYGALVLGIELP